MQSNLILVKLYRVICFRLVYVNRTTKTGRWFGKERTILSYNNSMVRITAFRFKVMMDYPKCFINSIAGGVNRNNVSLELKSAFNKGFCVQMQIYGRVSLKNRIKNVTKPTKNYIIYQYRMNKRINRKYKIIP